MGIKFIDGNILSRLSTNNTTYICQQVSCKGVMGAGLAIQIRSQWPVVYRRYLGLCYGSDGNKLGTYQEILVEPKLYIVNLFGQDGYGRIDVLPPLTEWDSMLTQCSYRVFQQQKLPDTLSFDRPVYLLPKAKLKGRAKCPKSQHKKCRYPLNKGFTYQVLLKAAHQGNQWGYVETP